MHILCLFNHKYNKDIYYMVLVVKGEMKHSHFKRHILHKVRRFAYRCSRCGKYTKFVTWKQLTTKY